MYQTIDICDCIAEQFRDLERVETLLSHSRNEKVQFSDHLMNDTLMYGTPGIAYFFLILDQLFPQKNWNSIVSTYLKHSFEKFSTRKKTNCSLLIGLSGLAAIVYFASKNDANMVPLLEKLDDLLIEKVDQSFLKSGAKYENQEIATPPNYYNFSLGLSGILNYLLLRKDHYFLYQLTSRLVDQLSRVMLCKKKINGQILPSWFVSPEYLYDKEKAWCPEGGIFLSFPLGISGCLSAFSTCAIKGIHTPHLHEAIEGIARSIREHISSQESFSVILPLGKEPVLNYEHERDNWAVGWPGVIRSLYLAGKALKDISLSHFAEETYVNFLNRARKDGTLLGPSFGSGKAGLLAINYLMAQETSNKMILQELEMLERDLISDFSPNHLFGFESVTAIKPGEHQIINDPSLCFGTAGIAISLLLAQGKLESFNHQTLLTY